MRLDVRKGRIAEARIREVPGYGAELRFLVGDALVESRMFRRRGALEQLAAEGVLLEDTPQGVRWKRA